MQVALFPLYQGSGTSTVQVQGTVMGVEEIIELLRGNLEVVVAVLSALVAVFGALISRNETRKQRELLLENVRQNIDAQSLGWGNMCIDTLNRCAMFARTRQHQANDGAFLQQRVNLMIALSSLVERGRLFFPNIEASGKGAEKEGAYRGSRPPILDALMFAYYEVEALSRTAGPTADNSAEFIEDCRRLLVSELQAHFDPRRRDAVVGRYDDQRLEHRKDARERAETLKTMLSARRPNLKFDVRKETVQ